MNTLFDTETILPISTGDVQILAIDQSSTVSGLRRINIEGGREIASDIDTFDLREILGDRAKLLAWDTFIREELSRGYTWVFMERPITASGPAAGTTVILHKIAGIIELACAKRPEVRFVQVAGARIKKFAGSQNKQQVLLLARDRWKEQITDDNAADAAWLGEIALHVVTGAEASNQARREVVRDVIASMAETVKKTKKPVKTATARTRKAVAA